MNLNDVLKEKGISMPELSRMTGINYYTIQKCCKRGGIPTIKKAKIIGKALGIPWTVFFED